MSVKQRERTSRTRMEADAAIPEPGRAGAVTPPPLPSAQTPSPPQPEKHQLQFPPSASAPGHSAPAFFNANVEFVTLPRANYEQIAQSAVATAHALGQEQKLVQELRDKLAITERQVAELEGLLRKSDRDKKEYESKYNAARLRWDEGEDRRRQYESDNARL